MIDLKTGTRIWIAAGFTDLRRGFQGLSTLVETVLEQQPYSGHVFVFRGKRGDLIKLLWFDGDGLCLFQKRLASHYTSFDCIRRSCSLSALRTATRSESRSQRLQCLAGMERGNS